MMANKTVRMIGEILLISAFLIAPLIMDFIHRP
jgi:hypothetical protein